MDRSSSLRKVEGADVDGVNPYVVVDGVGRGVGGAQRSASGREGPARDRSARRRRRSGRSGCRRRSSSASVVSVVVGCWCCVSNQNWKRPEPSGYSCACREIKEDRGSEVFGGERPSSNFEEKALLIFERADEAVRCAIDEVSGAKFKDVKQVRASGKRRRSSPLGGARRGRSRGVVRPSAARRRGGEDRAGRLSGGGSGRGRPESVLGRLVAKRDV